MDTFFLTLTWFGSLYLLAPLTLVLAALCWYQQRPSDALLLTLGLGSTSIVCHGLKIIFARPRPQVEHLLVTMPSDFSFPSAHTAQIVAFSLASFLVFSRTFAGGGLWLFLLLLVTLTVIVAISRVYLQVHYISDVLAGALLGGVSVFALYRLLSIFSGKG